MNGQAPFTLAPMMQPAQGSTFLGAMQRARGMFPKQGALPGVAPPQPNAPVNPGAPMPAGDPAYMPGGQGPMAGGPAMQPGLLQRMWGSLAPAPFPSAGDVNQIVGPHGSWR